MCCFFSAPGKWFDIPFSDAFFMTFLLICQYRAREKIPDKLETKNFFSSKKLVTWSSHVWWVVMFFFFFQPLKSFDLHVCKTYWHVFADAVYWVRVGYCPCYTDWWEDWLLQLRLKVNIGCIFLQHPSLRCCSSLIGGVQRELGLL